MTINGIMMFMFYSKVKNQKDILCFYKYLFQSVPGTGDKDKDDDKGMTIEEKKEAERQR